MVRALKAVVGAAGRWRRGVAAKAGERTVLAAELARLEAALGARLDALDRAMSAKAQAQLVLLAQTLAEVLVTELRRGHGSAGPPWEPRRAARPAGGAMSGIAPGRAEPDKRR
ncbi:hypothetical protein [Benzoatithermus flavus]|uniref:Transposase n=1 Tax=Benzoatithermus flavus TaxID=3108223 RepID=A0ABU8XPT3_9PROT